MSRNVREHELEKTLRSLPQDGSKMKELLLQLFNLDDLETGAPRTTDRWIMLPRYWIRMHMSGEIATLIQMKLSHLLMES